MKGRATKDGRLIEPQYKVTLALLGIEVTFTLTATLVPVIRGVPMILYVKLVFCRPYVSLCAGAAEKLDH